MRTITRDVASAFIFSNDNHILLGQSGPKGVYSELWCVPGGGIEPGETRLAAMLREVQEETALVLPKTASITEIQELMTGESEKVINGERVFVKMDFYDFVVELPLPAASIPATAGDDFKTVRWIPLTDLAITEIGPGTRKRLNSLGHY